ncbi:hypothetical protein P692DRAFT_203631 [Suillus brevipes Sb2]|nr:hypothetical protein P692DRAFT_203631 [Suillus brevipes Sb2]
MPGPINPLPVPWTLKAFMSANAMQLAVALFIVNRRNPSSLSFRQPLMVTAGEAKCIVSSPDVSETRCPSLTPMMHPWAFSLESRVVNLYRSGGHAASPRLCLVLFSICCTCLYLRYTTSTFYSI